MTTVNRFDHIFQEVELGHNLNSTLTEMNFWFKIVEFYYEVFHELLNIPFMWKENVKRFLNFFCEAFINFFNKLFPTSMRKKCQYLEIFSSAFFPQFPAFGLNTKRCGVSVRIRSKCRKMQEKCRPEWLPIHTLFMQCMPWIKLMKDILKPFICSHQFFFPVCLSVEISRIHSTFWYSKCLKYNERKLLSPLPHNCLK